MLTKNVKRPENATNNKVAFETFSRTHKGIAQFIKRTTTGMAQNLEKSSLIHALKYIL